MRRISDLDGVLVDSSFVEVDERLLGVGLRAFIHAVHRGMLHHQGHVLIGGTQLEIAVVEGTKAGWSLLLCELLSG